MKRKQIRNQTIMEILKIFKQNEQFHFDISKNHL